MASAGDSVIRTRRWSDAPEENEGLRVLVTRYRPRGVSKTDETWDVWWPHLGPSKALHAAYYAKVGQGISWTVYRDRYLKEMLSQRAVIKNLAEALRGGQSISLICSSACTRESRCHRSLLRELIEAELKRGDAADSKPV